MATSSPRGQVSTEILILIGMMLLLLLPLLAYAFNRAGVAREDLSVQKAEFAAHRLSQLADSVGYIGGASAIVDEIEIPPNVRGLSVSGRDIIFEIQSSSGRQQIVKPSSFTISGLGLDKVKKEGTYWFEVSALEMDDQTGKQVQIKVQ